MIQSRGKNARGLDAMFAAPIPRDQDERERVEMIRMASRAFAGVIHEVTPCCPEQTVAYRWIQHAMDAAIRAAMNTRGRSIPQHVPGRANQQEPTQITGHQEEHDRASEDDPPRDEVAGDWSRVHARGM